MQYLVENHPVVWTWTTTPPPPKKTVAAKQTDKETALFHLYRLYRICRSPAAAAVAGTGAAGPPLPPSWRAGTSTRTPTQHQRRQGK